MPIYAYKCDACGFAKDVLQKISDPVLTVCPSCGASSFQKQVTAAGFQLKGSGWYATDFKGGGTSAPAPSGSGGDKTEPKGGESKTESKSDAKPSESSPAPSPSTPSASAGGSGRACH